MWRPFKRFGRWRPTPPPDEATPINHDSVRRADPYAFEVAHRRLAWMFRVSTMMNVGLFAVVIVEASAIAQLVPLQKLKLGLIRIEPSTDRVVQVDPATRVRILPITETTEGFDLLMKSFVRRYVPLVKQIDPESQATRMHEARAYSDGDFWKVFAPERLAEFKGAGKTGLVRSIVVETATRLPTGGKERLYAVDFVQTDQRGGEIVETRSLRAYLTVTTRPQTVPESESYENPLGIRVLNMTVQLRGRS